MSSSKKIDLKRDFAAGVYLSEVPSPPVTSNVKPTFFQDRKLSFCCFCSKKDRIYSFLKQNSGSKRNVFNQYQKIFVQNLLFWSVSKKVLKPWRNFKRFGLIFVKMQKFYFIPSSLEQTKTFLTGKINLEIVPKSSFLFPLKPRYMKTFRCDNKLIRFCSGFVFKL